MKVAFLQGTLEKGGAEIMTFELAKRLAEKKIETSVISLRSTGDLAQNYQETGVSVFSGLLKYKFDIFALRRLHKLLTELEPDFLVVVDPLKNSLSMLGMVFRSVKKRPATFLWSHSTPGGQMGQFISRVKKAQNRWLDKIICISMVQKEIYQQAGILSGKIEVINNGIEVERFKKCAIKSLEFSRDKKFKFVQVANVMPDKDFATLFDACKLLKDHKLDFEISLVGRGSDDKSFLETIPENLPIKCLGPRENIPEILSCADGFVLASKSEVQSVSTLEAMVAGLAVIVPNLPSFYEICTDNFDSLKYQPADPHDLSLKMQKLITDRKLADDLAVNAVKTGLKFSAEKMSEKFIELFRISEQKNC